MDPFIGEIRIWGCNFNPRGWAFCNGQLLPIAQNTALFSILGTIYGGDGRTTFGLPNLEDSAAMGQGHGPGLATRIIGQKLGTSTETLTIQKMASHNHNLVVSASPGEQSGANVPAGSQNAFSRSVGGNIYGAATSLSAMASTMLQNQGGGAAHNNRQPYLSLNFCIALVGLYPPRS